jgi:hypothetical protein
MHPLSRLSLLATVSKHDVAGVVIAVVAVALLAGAGTKLVTRAVKGVLALLLLGVVAAIVAVLLLTRAI